MHRWPISPEFGDFAAASAAIAGVDVIAVREHPTVNDESIMSGNRA
jgi:hypothetical protein